MIPYSDSHHRHSVSPDRRIRMSQPTLNTSFTGINFVGMKGRLSYSSLRASGDNSINLQIEEERLSTPNVHVLGGYRDSLHQNPRHSQPDVRRMLRVDPATGKRERLSQPTLVTGDYYPGRTQQRLSQPCLTAWRENPMASLQSPIKFKRFGPSPVKRDRLSQLDFGAGRYRTSKDFVSSSTAVKFNRDRFSIPELETQNDLRLMAGTPKQRFSLDSQLNPEGRGTRRLLPIASSPISEHQGKGDDSSFGLRAKMPTEGLESVLVTSATPIFPPQDRQFLAPILKTTPPPPSMPAIPVVTRERMSVPEIRNSSLRRLLDSPVKQRHSITGNLRQSLLSQTKTHEIVLGTSEKRSAARASIDEAIEKLARIEAEKGSIEAEAGKKEETRPKHIQRHYSYTYDAKDEPAEVIGRLSVAQPRKKYLESNFDENEQVITTVIETEVPMILSSPKYTKKTHVYSSEAPKWMKKCLENESPRVARKTESREVARTNQRNAGEKPKQQQQQQQRSPERSAKKTSPKRGGAKEMQYLQPKLPKPKMLRATGIGDSQTAKNTYVSIKPSGDAEEHRYEVSVEIDWPPGEKIEQPYGEGDGDGDSDSEDSTSI